MYLPTAGGRISYRFTVPAGTSETLTYGIPAGGFLNNVGARISLDGRSPVTVSTGIGSYGATAATDLVVWRSESLAAGSHTWTITSTGDSVNVYGVWIAASTSPSSGTGSSPSGSPTFRPYTGRLPRLYAVGGGVLVSSVSAWDRLSGNIRRTASGRLALQRRHLVALGRTGRLKLGRPKLRPSLHRRAGTNAQSVTQSTGHSPDVRVAASSIAVPAGHFPPFTSDASWSGNSLYMPCVDDIVATLIACIGTASPQAYDSADPTTGVLSAAEVAGGPIAYGQSGEELVANWYGLANLPSSTTEPVTATITYTGIPFSAGFGIGTCGAAHVYEETSWSTNGGPLAQSQTSWQPSSCIGDFSSQLPGAAAVVNDAIGVAQSAYSYATTVSGSSLSGGVCDALATSLGAGQVGQSVLSLIHDIKGSGAPVPSFSAGCVSHTFSWHSPGPLPGGTALQFQVEPTVDARVIGGLVVNALFGEVTVCVQAGSAASDCATEGSPTVTSLLPTTAGTSSSGPCTFATPGMGTLPADEPYPTNIEPNADGYSCIVAVDNNANQGASSTADYDVTISFAPPMRMGGVTYAHGLAVLAQTDTSDTPDAGNTNTVTYSFARSGTYSALVGIDDATTNAGGDLFGKQTYSTSSHMTVVFSLNGQTVASEAFTALGQASRVSFPVKAGDDLAIAVSNVQGEARGAASEPGQVDIVDPLVQPSVNYGVRSPPALGATQHRGWADESTITGERRRR